MIPSSPLFLPHLSVPRYLPGVVPRVLGAPAVVQPLRRRWAAADLSSPSSTLLCYRAHSHWNPRGSSLSLHTGASASPAPPAAFSQTLSGLAWSQLLVSSPQGWRKILINLSYRYRTLRAAWQLHLLLLIFFDFPCTWINHLSNSGTHRLLLSFIS